jgi:hypothetical protein
MLIITFFLIYGVRVPNNYNICVVGKEICFGFVIYDFGQIKSKGTSIDP